MTTFTENPFFSFVDNLVNGNSPNFASGGKIVELFDTGCDARTPGGTFRKTMQPDPAVRTTTPNAIPRVRQPYGFSQGLDKTPVNKNSTPATGSCEDQRQNIGVTRKSLKQWKPPKDKLPCTDSNGFAINPAPNPTVVEKLKMIRGSDNSGRVTSALGPAVNESNAREDPPGRYKAQEIGSNIRSSFDSRAKASPTKSSKVNSEATFNHGLKKFVNRAVEKDSISNCSTQLEAAKTSGRASKLPRSYTVAKVQPKVTPLTVTGRETRISSGSKTALTKVTGTKDKELRKKTTLARPRKNSEGETISNSKSPGDDSKAKLSAKQPDLSYRSREAPATIGSRVAASRVPLSGFAGRNLSITKSTAKPPANKVGKSKELVQVSKATEKPSLKVQKTESMPDNKSSTFERPPRKVPARPSTKCRNLTTGNSEVRNCTIGSQTKLPRPKTPLIVPTLLTQYKLQDKRQNEVSRYSRGSCSLVTESVNTRNQKTESNPKPRSSSGTPGRLSDRVEEMSSSKIPTVTSKTKFEAQDSVSLSGVQGVDEKDEEIELKTIFRDTSATGSRKQAGKSSPNVLVTNKTCKESKVGDPSAGSKVPRPVITKRFPVREMTCRTSSARTPIKKQESSTPRGTLKNFVETEAKKGSAKPSTPSTIRSTGHSPEAEKSPEALEIVEKEDEDEVVIAIMNPAVYNINSFATQYRKKSNVEKTLPRKTVHGGRIESRIDGHEQAYLTGRAIGLRVASMARAAKTESKRNSIRSGPKITTPIPRSLPDKSQEIVDIGVSVIEKLLAKKDSRIYSPSIRGDRAADYLDLEKTTKWSGRQWI